MEGRLFESARMGIALYGRLALGGLQHLLLAFLSRIDRLLDV